MTVVSEVTVMSVGCHYTGVAEDGAAGRSWYAVLVQLALHPPRSRCTKLHVSTSPSLSQNHPTNLCTICTLLNSTWDYLFAADSKYDSIFIHFYTATSGKVI